MNQHSRTARRIIRERAAAARAARTVRRRTAEAARRIAIGARSLTTHVVATGASSETAKGVVRALQDVARTARTKHLFKGKRARIRRTTTGFRRHAVTVWRYTRDQVARIAEQYKPRKAEYKAVRAALLAAA
jgi:hypothetical protein